MRALIFAAGKGERMRPLTDTRPKALLEVRGEPLIGWHLRALARAGIVDVVINTGWLGTQLPAALGDGADYGMRIQWSHEPPDPYETGGGMRRALAEETQQVQRQRRPDRGGTIGVLILWQELEQPRREGAGFLELGTGHQGFQGILDLHQREAGVGVMCCAHGGRVAGMRRRR